MTSRDAIERLDEVLDRVEDVRVPGPDATCLILVGLSDEDAERAARLLGDGYSIRQYWISGGKAYEPCYRAVSIDFRYEYLRQLPQVELPGDDLAYQQIGAEGYALSRVTEGDETVPTDALIAYDDHGPWATVYVPGDGARPVCWHLGSVLRGLDGETVHIVEARS